MEDLLHALRAAGEATRLRIVAILGRSELTVSELCRVLGQTQPRVSRHLRLLCEAGVLERHAQGASAFYRPARSGRGRELFVWGHLARRKNSRAEGGRLPRFTSAADDETVHSLDAKDGRLRATRTL